MYENGARKETESENQVSARAVNRPKVKEEKTAAPKAHTKQTEESQ